MTKKITTYTFICIFISFVSFLLLSCQSKQVKFNERYYQNIMCKDLNGITEYTLPDKTRVDCLTSDYAIEVDWAKKWAQGIGQSLYYAHMTDKKPAIALIVGKKDKRYLKRLRKIANKYNIKVIILDKK